jgi:hypothetical protein
MPRRNDGTINTLGFDLCYNMYDVVEPDQPSTEGQGFTGAEEYNLYLPPVATRIQEDWS